MDAQVTVDERGITLAGSASTPLDVLFDDHRVWSFLAGRDGEKTARNVHEVPWPPALRRFLDGATRVVVRPHTGGEALFDDEVSFGTSTERVDVTDESGYPLAVDKGGRMQRAFTDTDAGTKEVIIEAVQRVLHDLREECGLEAFLAFGCLLGAVRNGRMIGHDSDADVAYLSRHTHPFDVIRENHAAARRMRELGWTVVRMSEADFKVWVDLGDGRRGGVDVFGGYHVLDTFYLMPNVSGRLDRSALLPVVPITIEGREVPGPARPEELLALTYGKGWKVPDPSFKFTPAPGTVRRTNGWMRGRRNLLRHWHDFYKPGAARGLPTEGSAFAAWVAERIEPGSPVLDVGAGNGRDAQFFADLGHPVTALDATVNGLRLLRQRDGGRVARRFVNFNEVRTPLLVAAGLVREERPQHLHARFLLDSLSDLARHSFWRFAAVVQRRGGLTFVEFRTRASKGEPTAFPAHQRQYLVPTEVVAEIERHGGRVVERDQGRGRAVLRKEDPVVCRLVVRWDGTRTPEPDVVPPRLPGRVDAVAAGVQRIRGTHQRLHDLVDLVQGVLVEASDPEDEQVRAGAAKLDAKLAEG